VHQLDIRRRVLAINLAALAGFVDATGFLAGAGYFVSFMSGNTTRLAVDLADGGPGLVPALAIVAFVIGVIGGALVAMRSAASRKPAVLALVAALLLIAAVAGTAGLVRAALIPLAMAMGALNNVFQRDGEVAVGLTYMTGALVRLGQGLAARLAGRNSPGWSANLWLWLGLFSGAVAGAATFPALGLANAWLACLWCAGMALTAAHLLQTA
jgi:uncharacterized membrane protein YoaK (UPF0700 family)